MVQRVAAYKASPEYAAAVHHWGPIYGNWEMVENMQAAYMEGRLHPDLAVTLGVETGRHECDVCGMRHWDAEDASRCCYPLEPGVTEHGERTTWNWEAAHA